jgi:hypothetical protein
MKKLLIPAAGIAVISGIAAVIVNVIKKNEF